MVNQHALRATTEFSLLTTSGKILRKNSRPDLEHFSIFEHLPPLSAVPKSGYPFHRKNLSLRYVFGGKIT